MVYDVDEARRYIREAARRRGVDPDIALRVAQSEGLARGVWQSNVQHPTRGREPSYGPFQLLVGGQGGWPRGMGNAFQEATGLDPSDPQNWRQTVDFAIDQAAQDGWRQWYGAGHAGIGRWDGVRGARPMGVTLTSLGPGDRREPIAAEAGGAAPSLVDRGTLGERNVAEPLPLPQQPPAVPEENEGLLAMLAGLGENKQVGQGMQMMQAAMGGGQQENPVMKAHREPVQSGLGNLMATEDQSRQAMARQMMDGLLSARRKRVPGLSLTG